MVSCFIVVVMSAARIYARSNNLSSKRSDKRVFCRFQSIEDTKRGVQSCIKN